jgi:hypothetical protein
VTGMALPSVLTSRFDPAESREKGSRVQPAPLRGRGALAVREGRHSVTELTLAMLHSPPRWRGWVAPRELAEQRRGVIPGRVMTRLCCVRALNARTRVREQVVSPRARRNPLEGAFDWATPVGRGGHRSVGRAPCACLGKRCVLLLFFQVLSRILPVS